jgi:hypothetical protein
MSQYPGTYGQPPAGGQPTYPQYPAGTQPYPAGPGYQYGPGQPTVVVQQVQPQPVIYVNDGYNCPRCAIPLVVRD